METRIASATREVIIGAERPTVLIGERINAAARKSIAEAARSGNWEVVSQEALAQAQAGADVIDINMNVFGADEAVLLPAAVRAVMEAVDAPICLDSTNSKALEAALKAYKGKPLVNSVTGEGKSLQGILPLVKEYGAAVIGLTQDEAGVAGSAGQRVAVAHKIMERAAAEGIPAEDIIIDCLALSLGADPGAGLATIEAIRRVKAELGVNLTLGASNISFGLPDRNALNGTFLAMCIAAGVNCPIVDAAAVRRTVLAVDLILGRDRRARRYIGAYRDRAKR